MANQKVSALTGLAGASVTAADDVLPIVDTSVTTTKKITVDDLLIGMMATTGVTRVKVGSLTRDTSQASGSVSYTGVGFKPKAVIFLGTVNTTDVATFGVDDGTTAGCVFHTSDTLRFEVLTSQSQFASDTVNAQAGKISSMDADGFTVAWTKTLSPTGTLTTIYLALR